MLMCMCFTIVAMMSIEVMQYGHFYFKHLKDETHVHLCLFTCSLHKFTLK
jgi:hypothetical protein